MAYFPVILLFLIAFFLLVRPLTVLLHELGHAIPAIIMTRRNVSIYIGSYGDPRNSVNFKLGLLDVWFKYNPSSWLFGLCVPSAKEISINKKVICTLAGPLTSFFIAAMAFYFTLALDLNGAAKLIFVILLGSSIFDLFVNLIPNATSIRLYDGSFCYNDGYQLKQLFYYKRFPKEYEVAIGLYNQKVFDKAAILFKGMLDRGINHEDIYRFAISSFFEAQNYNTAKELVEEFFTHGNITSDDYIYAGATYINMNELEKALMHFDKSLELDNQNKYSLNNKGFVMNLLDKFEEAIPLFDKAIEVDPEFAYPYNNRGLAKIKIGKAKEGLEDINYSLKLDKNNSYCYRNLGIYHLDQGNYSEALELFLQAKYLDHTTQLIEDLIITAEGYVEKKM